MNTTVKIQLKPGKEMPLKRQHPWVFSGAVARVQGNPLDGDLAEVVDSKGLRIGVGHFHHGSIAVRMLCMDASDPASDAFWVDAIRTAYSSRQRHGLLGVKQTTCYRLLHGEGDGLSGLIVDVYGSVAVLQCHSIGMHRQRQQIAEALRAVFGSSLEAVYDKSAETLPAPYAAGIGNAYLWGEATAPGSVLENDVPFLVDWVTGQKTGFFLDQRENRALLARYAQGQSVLNTFCYTGGFSAYALRAGARLVHSVDVSEKAMALTEQHAAMNSAPEQEHRGFTEDVLRFLSSGKELYDIAVVDPPAFAKSLEKRHNAVQGYKRLNAAAISRIRPGGLLFTFSCSQVVDRELFYHTIVAAALETGRSAQVLHQLSQGPDHPVSLYHPEGSYLKGLVLRL